MAIMPLILYIVMAMMALPALIIVCLMYGTGVVLALNQQYVRHIAVCVLELGCVIRDRCNMGS